MSRKTDLEHLIRNGANLVHQLEEMKQVAADPIQNRRLEIQIKQQWDLCDGYLNEYKRLVEGLGEICPEDIHEIAVSRGIVIVVTVNSGDASKPKSKSGVVPTDPPREQLPGMSSVEQQTIIPFRLQLFRTSAGLEVRSESQLMGQAREVVQLPPFRRLSVSANAQERQQIGAELYRAAITGQVRTALEAARNQARVQQTRLALQLRFDADAVDEARRPWELLHDGEQFLLLAGMDLTRYVMFSQAVVPVMVEPPLKVLMVCPAPRNHPPLNCAAGRKMFRALPNASMQELAPPTYRQLLTRLGPGQPAVHVFDFEGHGFAHGGGSGLCFETADGALDAVRADALGVALSGSRMALAVLNACHGADVDGITVFNGVAPALILAGVPAVIGMQGPISDAGANDFKEALYDGISHCVPLTKALAHARRFLYQSGEWYVPVLYLRTTDEVGRILIGCPDQAPVDPPQHDPTRIKVTMPDGWVVTIILEQVEPVKLRNAMQQGYGGVDLQILCFDLGVDYDDLGGDTLSVKIQSLIEWHRNRGVYAVLVQKVLQDRPHLARLLA